MSLYEEALQLQEEITQIRRTIHMSTRRSDGRSSGLQS